MLMVLSMTCRPLLETLKALIEQRCKRECVMTYLYPTVASYRMQAAVPATWRQLYVAFNSLKDLCWQACRGDMTSSSLRALKSDNYVYESDITGTFLIRSGGHYWFSVLQANLVDATIGEDQNVTEAEGHRQKLPFVQSSRQILMGKWEKLRPTGQGPCPRRNYSMTCLTNAFCTRKLIMGTSHVYNGVKSDEKNEEEMHVNVRRIIFFGGQSEGIPFEAFGDLHLLCIQQVAASSLNTPRAVWVQTNVTVQAPPPRCGHAATLLSSDLILITGGSMGVSPILKMDVFLLHIEGCTDFRWSTPSCSSLIPTGRSLHDVHRVSECEVFIYGGRQIRQSNCLLDVHKLQITTDINGGGDTLYSIKWTKPRLLGSLPCPRRGHSTNTIGPKLLLFGGQNTSTGQLENDVCVLNIPDLRWRRLDVPGKAPCSRRGFKNQFFGTTVVISSGFVRSNRAGKVDYQLSDSDVHVLSLL